MCNYSIYPTKVDPALTSVWQLFRDLFISSSQNLIIPLLLVYCLAWGNKAISDSLGSTVLWVFAPSHTETTICETAGHICAPAVQGQCGKPSSIRAHLKGTFGWWIWVLIIDILLCIPIHPLNDSLVIQQNQKALCEKRIYIWLITLSVWRRVEAVKCNFYCHVEKKINKTD